MRRLKNKIKMRDFIKSRREREAYEYEEMKRRLKGVLEDIKLIDSGLLPTYSAEEFINDLSKEE